MKNEKNLSRVEDKHYDRKSARIKPIQIVQHVIGFANAEGGQLVIGIEDDGTITGFNNDRCKAGEFEKTIQNDVVPVPQTKCTYKEVTNVDGMDDFILIIDIEINYRSVYRSTKNKYYLRVGDSTKELSYEQIKKLEYDKGQNYFEDEYVKDAILEDLDEKLIIKYKENLGCENKGTEDLLKSRNFIKDGKLTNAAIILFGQKEKMRGYFPQSRIRFLRYDGIVAETGERMNIVKEFDLEGAIPYLLEEVIQMIKTQLREYQFLQSDGRFAVVPEYPEFAWVEGIVNALTHRSYELRGDYIRVKMFDDRIEIFSPGGFPNIVTAENLKETRYSRNPQIARTLTELGWVRELNEGVSRIYEEMKSLDLKEPVFTEPNKVGVQLILKNNISIKNSLASIDDFSEREIKVLSYLIENETITVQDGVSLLEIGRISVGKNLSKMVERGILFWNGSSKTDPKQYYTVNYTNIKRDFLNKVKKQ